MKCIVRNINAEVSSQPSFSIRGISFALGEGQILAILGPSGAGKTSLLNAIAGFLPVQHGAILLDDQTVSCASFCLPPMKRNIGVIFQDHNLLPHVSLRENLTLGIDKTEAAERKKEIQAMLRDLHIDHLQESFPYQVSGGQQQRVALGRAILHDKKLLLFDEPFSGLDQARMVKLAHTIRESVKKYKRIAILVTHHIEEAFLIADMIGIMKDGQLLEVAVPEAIYHEPSRLDIAEYVGPVNIIEGTRESSTKIKTVFGSVQSAQHIPSSLKHVQLLTRPDDYKIVSGGKFTVDDILFAGMTQLVTLTCESMSVKVSLEHHQNIRAGDKAGVVLKNDHVYRAYDSNGLNIKPL